MLNGILYSLMAGVVISLQSVFSARMGEKMGFWETNAFVHGTGFILAFILMLLLGKPDLAIIKTVNPLYLTSGFIGVLIILSVSKGVSYLGVTYGITIMLVTQIVFSMIINLFGLFGEKAIHISPLKGFGLALMVTGILIYQLSN